MLIFSSCSFESCLLEVQSVSVCVLCEVTIRVSCIRPRYHKLTVSRVALITCKTVCVGKMTRGSQFSSAKIKTNSQKSVAMFMISRVPECAVSIRAVDEDLLKVCRDNDLLFNAPRIGLLPFKFFNLCSNQNTLRTWQRNKENLKNYLMRRATEGK